MKQIILISGFLLMLISCSKNKYEFTSGSACDLSGDNIRYVDTVFVNADTIIGIKAIISHYCTGCHSSPPSDSTLTYDYTNYDGVKRAIGSIYNRINRPVGDPLHMPKGQLMDPCSIAKLKAWIQIGAPAK